MILLRHMELINTWLTPKTIFGIAVIFAGVAVTVAYCLAARRRHYWHKTNLPTLQQYITQLTPLDWDKKVQVERYE